MSAVAETSVLEQDARGRIAILSLSLGAFAIGSSEFMISGLLRDVGGSLGVGIPTAGLLVSGYALGVVVGGPLMAILTNRLDRKHQLLLVIAIFVLGNLLCAMAPTYEALLAGRIVGAFCHGGFYGVASVVAGKLVQPHLRTRAVALVSAGVMVANVVGVPCGTALGQAFGWRAAFWVVSGMGILAAGTMVLCLPSTIGANAARLAAEFRALLRPAVMFGLLLSLVFTVGLFSLFTYITPLLTTFSGAEPEQLPILLLLFGCGATIGIIFGGRVADRGLLRAIGIALATQIAVNLAIIGLSRNLVGMHGLMLLLGLAGMVIVAPLRTLVIGAAGDAPTLAATLTSSAFNLGVAIGSAAGAFCLGHGLSYADLPWIGIACAAAGLGLLGIWHTAVTLSASHANPVP